MLSGAVRQGLKANLSLVRGQMVQQDYLWWDSATASGLRHVLLSLIVQLITLKIFLLLLLLACTPPLLPSGRASDKPCSLSSTSQAGPVSLSSLARQINLNLNLIYISQNQHLGYCWLITHFLLTQLPLSQLPVFIFFFILFSQSPHPTRPHQLAQIFHLNPAQQVRFKSGWEL